MTRHQPDTTPAKAARFEQLAVVVLLILIAATVLSCCPERMISVDAIKPSIDAVTQQFDELVDEAVIEGSMDPVEGATWKGESSILRHTVSDDVSAPIE
tara:strand:+ start:54123 stop:54419 length:297 start_codon:yes stop_codon:yes gene_type:complete